MKRGDIRAITIEGRTRHLEYLGAGHYCKAWRNGKDVFLFVKDDYCKEPLLDVQGIRHIPKMERLDSETDDQIYKTKYYPNVSAANKVAWGDYRAIQAALDKARQETMGKYPNTNIYVLGNEINRRVASNRSLSPNIRKALRELASAACNWGASITFEFAPRNLGVDDRGNLIFRDILFDAEKIFQERMQKQRRY